jgi:3,4-dihydroxyphenylacetate 2,3-dioxygenase
MGKIVAAAVVSHQPGIMLPSAVRLELYGGVDTSLVAGFKEMRQALDRVQADTFIIFDTHWFTTLNHILAGAPHFKGLYTSEELPEFLSDFPYDYTGAPELATAIAEAGTADGIRVLNYDKSNMPLHYPTINLVHYLRKNEKILSIGTCQAAQCHNFLDMGRAIAEGIARTDCRVALLAAGGMSHSFEPMDTMLAHMGPDPALVTSAEARDMDIEVLQHWDKGDHAGVIALYPQYRKLNPEGFFGHYLMMVGALGGPQCRAVGTKMSEYENAAGTGQVHVWFDVAA